MTIGLEYQYPTLSYIFIQIENHVCILYTNNNIPLYTHFISNYKINGIIFILPTVFVLLLLRRCRVIK